jgi:endonuclease G
MRNKLLYFTSFYIALVLLLASCRKSVNAESSNSQGTNANKSLTSNNLSFDFLPSSTTNQIVVHENYSLSYNEKYEQAEWVAYRLQEKHLLNNNFKRPFFIEDPKVISRSSDWRNYKNSGFDKGHLCPAGDMKFSKQAFNDTFFTSNISPQLHDFNDGVWNRLEQKVRYWASKYGEIYVVTGGVLQNGLKTIGKEKIAVPNYFYKVLIYKSNGNFHMIGFLVPHQDSDLPLYKFVVPVDKIEQITKIDFFPEMGDSIENELEKSNNYKEWSFN